jgi:hypothetical protein
MGEAALWTGCGYRLVGWGDASQRFSGAFKIGGRSDLLVAQPPSNRPRRTAFASVRAGSVALWRMRGWASELGRAVKATTWEESDGRCSHLIELVGASNRASGRKSSSDLIRETERARGGWFRRGR